MPYLITFTLTCLKACEVQRFGMILYSVINNEHNERTVYFTLVSVASVIQCFCPMRIEHDHLPRRTQASLSQFAAAVAAWTHCRLVGPAYTVQPGLSVASSEIVFGHKRFCKASPGLGRSSKILGCDLIMSKACSRRSDVTSQQQLAWRCVGPRACF
jgi:hypothetical protein